MEEKVFYKDNMQEFISYITEAGTIVPFYKGYTRTNSEEVIAFLAGIGAKEVKDPKDIPEPPTRSRNRSWAAAAKGPETVITPTEILQKAIASSKATPQAAESNSTGK